MSLLKGEANFRQVQTIVKYSNGDAVLFPRLRQLEESQLTPEYVRKRVMDEYHRLMEATHDPDISDALRSSQVAHMDRGYDRLSSGRIESTLLQFVNRMFSAQIRIVKGEPHGLSKLATI